MVMPAATRNDLLENYAMLQYKVKALQGKIEEFQRTRGTVLCVQSAGVCQLVVEI